MVWTKITRAQHARDHLRYASDLTEAEWALIAPALPAPARLGRPRTTDLRAVIDALLYILATGCQWRALPREFPPRSTVQRYFYGWRDQGLWERLNRVLVEQARQALGREPCPSLAVIDSQSVPTTESGGPRGTDAAKRVRGRKRHIVTDTQGFVLHSLSILPTSRTVMAPCRSCGRCTRAGPACTMCWPTGSTGDASSSMRSPTSAIGPSISSSGRGA